jgi:hypothetical protein
MVLKIEDIPNAECARILHDGEKFPKNPYYSAIRRKRNSPRGVPVEPKPRFPYHNLAPTMQKFTGKPEAGLSVDRIKTKRTYPFFPQCRKVF